MGSLGAYSPQTRCRALGGAQTVMAHSYLYLGGRLHLGASMAYQPLLWTAPVSRLRAVLQCTEQLDPGGEQVARVRSLAWLAIIPACLLLGTFLWSLASGPATPGATPQVSASLPSPTAQPAVPVVVPTPAATLQPTPFPTSPPQTATVLATALAQATPESATTTPSPARTPQSPAGSTFYVSKLGSNGDGRSWASAWNELSRINWSIVQPGDSILLDGGSSQMVYTSTLTPTKSGTAAAPITIKLASDPGRNGQVAIFGGRSTPLPYCYQPASQYTYQTAGVRNRGIDISAVSWLVIDGSKWRGLAIYGHNRIGIGLGSTSSNITIRNVEVYDNGNATLETNTANSHYNTWYPDLPGITPNGNNNTVERAIIHDNGQDAFQSGGGIANLTIRQSWLYNGRTHPSGPDIPWNYCRHSDGIQVYNGGVQTGLTIDGSVFGPGFLQGTLLGQSGSAFAQFDNVTIRNTLFINASNTNISGYGGTSPQNWVIDHVTSYVNRNTTKAVVGGFNFALSLQGSNHQITNSVFYDGRIDLAAATNVQSSGNCSYNLISGSISGITADPQFVAPPPGNPPTIQDSINANFALKPGSPCTGKGSSITSIALLLGQTPSTLGGKP